MNEQLHHELPVDPLERERLLVGNAIVGRIRTEANELYGGWTAGDSDPEPFREIYLTERTNCIPDQFVGEDLTREIRTLFYTVFDEVRNELDIRMGRRDESHWLFIDADYEDDTTALLTTDDSVLFRYTSKASAFTWDSEKTMAESLGDIYQRAANQLLIERRVLASQPYGTRT